MAAMVNTSATRAKNKQGPVFEYWPPEVDSAWQEQMVLQYAPLIKYIASRLALRLPSHISLEDLISSGVIGLIDAIHKFDPGKNISFKTYADFRIKGAILDELRELDWVPRSVRKKTHLIENAYAELQKTLGRPAETEEVAEALGLDMEKFYRLLDETRSVSLVEMEGVWEAISGNPDLAENDVPEIIQDENLQDPFMAVYFSQLQEAIVRGIEALPDKEKLLISLYYYEELAMKEIGQIMGCTESRISRLHTQAMLRLRGKLRKHFSQEDNSTSIPMEMEQQIKELSECQVFLDYLRKKKECVIESELLVQLMELHLIPEEVNLLWRYFENGEPTTETALSFQKTPDHLRDRRRTGILKIVSNR